MKTTRNRFATLRKIKLNREAVLVLILIFEVVLFSRLSPYFFTVDNLLGSIRAYVEIGIIALGMTLVIISGGIDLSVGSLLALVSVTIGFSFRAGVPFGLSILLGLVVGVLGGALNGICIVHFKLHPFVVTLGTQSLFRGIAYAVTNAEGFSSFPTWFQFFGNEYVGAIPMQLFIFAVAVFLMLLIMDHNRFGSYVCGIGYNNQATFFSGIPVKKINMAVYLLMGLLVALASIIYSSRMSTARANAGLNFEMTVIAAVVLGGTDINGGRGSIFGTLLGVLIVAFINNGLMLAGVSSNWSMIILGIITVICVGISGVSKKKKAKTQPVTKERVIEQQVSTDNLDGGQ